MTWDSLSRCGVGFAEFIKLKKVPANQPIAMLVAKNDLLGGDSCLQRALQLWWNWNSVRLDYIRFCHKLRAIERQFALAQELFGSFPTPVSGY